MSKVYSLQQQIRACRHFIVPFLVLSFSCSSPDTLRQNFIDPPLSIKSRPLWFWNQPLSHGQTLKVMTESKEAGYAGLGIVPSYGMTPEYMTPGFLEQYHYALDVADSLGLKLYLYDEFYFPSGMAGGNLVKKYPEAVSKRLDMEEFLVKGNREVDHPLPAGLFLGAVCMDTVTLQRIDLTGSVIEKRLRTTLPLGAWRVMIFTLNPDKSSDRYHCDYLSPEAVGRFVELTYEKFFAAFPQHFGTTIDYAFYDEPCLRWVEGGRTWTGDFNEKFKAGYGFNPITLYPSLWYNIGPETEASRNLLLGFRAELYARGFPKVLNDWCNAHGIQLTGHVDQEEILNPVAICGDLVKAFKYQDIPAVDQIFFYRRSELIYKVISSAASNYDRPLVATECYGAMGKLNVETLYKEAMDQFARGINLMEPHAVWYNDTVDIPQDLSPGSKKFGSELPAFNEYIGRLQCLLQGGSRVAEIGVLYPIASLQGCYHFGPGDPGVGGVIPWEADYLDVGRMLTSEIRCDFTFIHPEILDEKCNIRENLIQLDNAADRQDYRVFILPGSTTIHLSNLRKIKDFYDAGGKVIATSTLPVRSAEPGKDAEVRQLVESMFGKEAFERSGMIRVTASSQSNTGGNLPAYMVDGRQETSWKPSQDDRTNAVAEIWMGGERDISGISLATPANGSLRCRILILDDSGRTIASSGLVGLTGTKDSGADTTINIKADGAAAVKIIQEAGSKEMAISEVGILDPQGAPILNGLRSYCMNSNQAGGKAFFVPVPDAGTLEGVLDEAGLERDVRFVSAGDLRNGSLACIHKKLNNRDVYFIANSSDQEVNTEVLLKGTPTLEIWNPRTGMISPLESGIETLNGSTFTRVRLNLGPVESVFWVSTENSGF